MHPPRPQASSQLFRCFGAPLARVLTVRWLGIMLAASACARVEHPPAIAYSDLTVGPHVGQIAQATIAEWRTKHAPVIPLGWANATTIRPGYSGDIDLAESMVKLPGLVAAVGPLSSRATFLVLPIYAELGLPLISPTATSSRLRTANPWVFLLAPDDGEEGEFLATFLLDNLHARRVTIFYLAADEYGLGLRRGVAEALRRRGVEPIDEIAINEAADYPRLLEHSLRGGKPEAIVLATRSEEATAIVKAVWATLPRVPIVLGDGASLPATMLDIKQQARQQVYAVRWWNPKASDPNAQRFVARYRQLTDSSPTVSDAMQYDAVMVAAQAVREAGPKPEAIRRYLGQLGTARPPYPGVTGPIAFNAGRHVNLLMINAADGTPVAVKRP